MINSNVKDNLSVFIIIIMRSMALNCLNHVTMSYIYIYIQCICQYEYRWLWKCVLVHEQVIRVDADQAELRTLRRHKREWIIPPRKLYENVDYTKDDFIAKVRVYISNNFSSCAYLFLLKQLILLHAKDVLQPEDYNKASYDLNQFDPI